MTLSCFGRTGVEGHRFGSDFEELGSSHGPLDFPVPCWFSPAWSVSSQCLVTRIFRPMHLANPSRGVPIGEAVRRTRLWNGTRAFFLVWRVNQKLIAWLGTNVDP